MLELADVTPTGKLIAEINGEYYMLRYKDRGELCPADKGLWRSIKVWRNQFGNWVCCDDDDWLIDRNGKIVAREIGWDLRREKINE